MSKKITLIEKNKFGNYYLYPSCSISEVLCEMLDTITIPRRHIRAITKLGFDIEIIHEDGKKEILKKF